MLFTGCSSNKAPVSSSVVNTVAEQITIETTQETTKAPEPFKFNPHPRTELLSEYVTNDMWESLHNLIDAVRTGEDSFKCSSKDTFKWCTDDCILGSFYPPACTLVVADRFENGTGYVKYKMDKDKFLERGKAFEKEIERMLNEAIRTDYSDFEKVMAIFAYICKNFQYDYSTIDGNTVDEFSDYACLTTKKGICCEIGGSYAYLLLQCGVEAMPFSGYGGSGYHTWTYIKIGGQGYHSDATWGLCSEYSTGNPTLTYFMMTEEERVKGSFEEYIEPDWIWTWKKDYDLKNYSATDARFKEIHDGCELIEMDTEKNIIKYKEPYNGEVRELSYGDL